MLQRIPRLSSKSRLALLKEFVRHHTATEAGIEVGCNRSTANLYFNHFRQCLLELYEKSPRFTGEVEVDEAYFGRSYKHLKAEQRMVRYKGKIIKVDPWDYDPYAHKRSQRSDSQRVLVFGVLERGGGVYTQIIEHRDDATLRAIINLVIDKKAVIHSDMNPVYTKLKKEGYKFKQVNHSQGFINKKGVHIGSIESFWSKCRDHFRRFRGIRRRTYILHLKECEWRWNHRDPNKKKEFDTLFKLMRSLAFSSPAS